jgi:CBS domain-containing protein
MRCPYCGQENLEGDDTCTNCGRELMGDDIPGPTRGLQAHLMTDTIEALGARAPAFVPDDATVADAVWVMRDQGMSCVVVTERGRPAGILTDRDVLLRVAGRETETLGGPVRAVMRRWPDTLRADDSARFAFHTMAIDDIRHVPFVRDGEVVGVISAGDVLRYLAAIFASPDRGETAVVEST